MPNINIGASLSTNVLPLKLSQTFSSIASSVISLRLSPANIFCSERTICCQLICNWLACQSPCTYVSENLVTKLIRSQQFGHQINSVVTIRSPNQFGWNNSVTKSIWSCLHWSPLRRTPVFRISFDRTFKSRLQSTLRVDLHDMPSV